MMVVAISNIGFKLRWRYGVPSTKDAPMPREGDRGCGCAILSPRRRMIPPSPGVEAALGHAVGSVVLAVAFSSIAIQAGYLTGLGVRSVFHAGEGRDRPIVSTS
jgi:hypothetical protein